jgi:hypothetical protein
MQGEFVDKSSNLAKLGGIDQVHMFDNNEDSKLLKPESRIAVSGQLSNLPSPKMLRAAALQHDNGGQERRINDE